LRARRASIGLILSLALAAGCSLIGGKGSPAGPEETPSLPAIASPAPTPTVTPVPVGPVAVPATAAHSGTLYRVGWKSDAPEFVYGPPGQKWILASAGQAEVLRGTFRFQPVGRVAAALAVQVGAFSSEETAKATLDRLAAQFSTTGAVAFSADRGVYRVLLGTFADRAAADAFADTVRAAGQDAVVVPGSVTAPVPGSAPSITATGEDGSARRLISPIDLFPADSDAHIVLDGKPYRGSLRIQVNARGLLNVIDRLDLEEYLYGVVPAEMGPKRFDELEALKAQAVAARTYALAHKGEFEAEGYDICATPKCQVYAGLSAEDPLSTAAVDATRGLILASKGKVADALFVSTCGGRTENVENVFGQTPEPYLVSVACGELATTSVPGAALEKGKGAGAARTGLQWRGYVLRRHAPRRRAIRAAELALAQEWAGVSSAAMPPARLLPSQVYPSLLEAFDLDEARNAHFGPRVRDYYGEAPSVSGGLAGAASEAYGFLLRFRFGAGETLPAPDQTLDEEEYAGLLFSAALRLSGVIEASGKFLQREGANLWIKTPEGRIGLPVDPELPLARRAGERYFPAAALTLRAGDRLRWWKRGGRILGLWVEMDQAGPTFERESTWTEWVRRISGRELARRMSQRVAGTEVRDLIVTRRSPAGRVVEMDVVTDAARLTLKRFEVRQALELPELLFTLEKVRGAQGEREYVFLGRGWGHGVGLCQNGAYGMALAGAAYDDILRHYYIGVDIVTAATVAGPPVAAASPKP
jgi:peptidoglycan hydrolase-like amidase